MKTSAEDEEAAGHSVYLARLSLQDTLLSYKLAVRGGALALVGSLLQRSWLFLWEGQVIGVLLWGIQ